MAAHSQHADLVVAVVLARADSKGVPGKNTALIAGKPCVAWTIEHAMAAKAVDVVVVSSDCDEVLAIAGEMGAIAHRRPDALASDTARVDDALRDAVAWCESDPQHPGNIGAAVLLYGNVPVRPEGLIDRAVALWQQTGCDSVQSYAPVGKYHPWWQTRVTADGRVEPWEGDRLFGGVYRRQQLPPSYVPDGGVVVVSRSALFHEADGVDATHPHAFLGADHRGVVNDEGAVVDIDSPIDLVVAEASLRRAFTTENTENTERDKPRRAGHETAHPAGTLRDGELSEVIIGAAIEVHRALGPGMLESAYEECLAVELISRGLHVKRQVPVPLVYKDRTMNIAYRIDLLIADRVVIELKTVERVLPIHEAQLLSYLRMSGKRVGLLMNFNVKLLKNGITRRVL